MVVDVRKNSPTFGKWFGAVLDEDGVNQIYMPKGFAHGFCTLSDKTILHYKVTEYFDPTDDAGIHYLDPDLSISWPNAKPIISVRDNTFPFLKEIF